MRIMDLVFGAEYYLRIGYSTSIDSLSGSINDRSIGWSLAAVKLLVPVEHIEASAGSHDMRMPEEVNRG
ncbi:MAG: hypothetical protein JSW61_01915 [Candidatus Thorarchaeota archaeon]|nr:MAG: hypothetical protein JSW61_01915 [Candidatus Thorarchaeota archaeon]